MEKLKHWLFILTILGQMALGMCCIWNPTIAPVCVGLILINTAWLITRNYAKDIINGKSDK